MGKKKNRSNTAEDKDQVIARLTKQNEELQKKLDRLLEGLLPPESGGGAASAAAKKKEQEEAARKAADKKKAAEKEKAWHLRKAAEKRELQEKENSKRAGDTLDEEWEIVDRETKKEKSRAEKTRAEVSIHGATLLPAQSAASRAKGTPVTQADGLDPRDWDVELRPATGKERLKVGQDGLVLAKDAREITAVLHDLQATDAKAAMLSYDKAPDSILAPVRMWKDGKAALKRL